MGRSRILKTNRPVVQVVITTPAFVAGQEAARKDFAKDPGLKPNDALLDRIGGEFVAGYRYEFREYIQTHPNYGRYPEEWSYLAWPEVMI
jgi:hypothetical protein